MSHHRETKLFSHSVTTAIWLLLLLPSLIFLQIQQKAGSAIAKTLDTSIKTTTTEKTTTPTPSSDQATTATDVRSALSDYKKAAGEKKLAALKKVGDKMVDVRTKDLNSLKVRLGKIQCLTDTDRTAMTAELDATISGLNDQKTKIDAATTVDTLKPLVQGIRTDFRVYMVIVPKEHGLVGVCRAEATKKHFDDLVVKIQAEINKVKNAGKDITSVQKLLDDFKAQLEGAGKQLTTAREKFAAMKVASGDDANKELRTAGHTALKAAHEALKNAKKSLTDIRTELKSLSKTTSTGTSSETTSTAQ